MDRLSLESVVKLLRVNHIRDEINGFLVEQLEKDLNVFE